MCRTVRLLVFAALVAGCLPPRAPAPEHDPFEADAHLEGTEFVARTPRGERRGPDFTGAELVGLTERGDEAPIRIESVERSDRPGFEDVLRYVVSVLGEGGPTPLCGLDDAGAPVRAIPLQGRWDPSSGGATSGGWIADPGAFTFACEGATLAKCVYLGFKPWAGTVTHCPRGSPCRSVDLRRLHQACVRMLRADYCGDGVPHTVDGTLIAYRDGFGILSSRGGWPVEAEWVPEGARCVVAPRIPSLPPPPCLARLRLPDCGDERHFESGTLLVNGVPR